MNNCAPDGYLLPTPLHFCLNVNFRPLNDFIWCSPHERSSWTSSMGEKQRQDMKPESGNVAHGFATQNLDCQGKSGLVVEKGLPHQEGLSCRQRSL